MDNKINGYSGISFQSRRYMIIKNPENIPSQIKSAIQNSTAIQKFLHNSKPTTLWEKFISMFKKDEVLNISYEVTNKSPYDKYAQTDVLNFKFSDGKINREGSFSVKQKGIQLRKQELSATREGNEEYKPPIRTAAERIAKMIESLKDLNSILM